MEYIDGSDPVKLIDASVAAQLLFASCFFISSWWQAANYYAGFNVLLTSAVFIASPALAWYILRRCLLAVFFLVI